MADFSIIENIPEIAAGLLLFIGVFLAYLGGTAIVGERRLATRRLGTADDYGDLGGSLDFTFDDNFLGALAKFLTPSDSGALSKIRTRLEHAGYRRLSAVRVFYLSKAVFALGFTIVALILVPLLTDRLIVIVALVAGAFLAGYLLPSYWVERSIQYRRQSAELGFPDLLDLLLVCIEAGNSIDQATRRVAKEIHSVSPVLAEELGIINDELRAGKERFAVFRDFADRLGVPDISAFATALRQSDEFGVSISDTLRVYAAEMRDKRIMRAETKANLMPLQLALGTMLFTVPPTMLIMGGPSVLAILSAFAGMGK